MNLYDLEALARSPITPPDDLVLRRDVTFALVMDDLVIPPLEVLDGLADRELILANQQVLVQRRVARDSLDVVVARALQGDAVDGGDGGGGDPAAPGIEYEVAGTLPEGAFLLDGYFPVVHVGKQGKIRQVDLMRRAGPGAVPPVPPVNKEFNKILLAGVKEHGWDELAVKFSAANE